ncbi:hypothetical protein BABINDRAFT_166890 [Babjeviella inositovora NRRL Y-12698]|uniref:Phospholipid/glycerol acyltransferase domain-containing protein n=1 Tax=Babjeviella inositovora NRRL Y-12698 TaxID=984486 RepID=A0A1E3QQ07_9ASCO|nr:uncharacterized protein BABINDRAFT_166890 [Babjeviella inositovora NRRL Y-12698]ODQ79783.1 hypothetical protein BABINDRAFT_166890 [Babjeviella inositovora NRRL Y-12698]
MDSQFDFNILENPFGQPTIPLEFPFPAPENLNAHASEFSILGTFLETISSCKYSEVYTYNEFRHPNKPVQLYNKEAPFHKDMLSHMREKLAHDEKLAAIVAQVVAQEVANGLVKDDAASRAARYEQVKTFMAEYYATHNQTNFPKFESLPLLRVSYFTVMKIFTKIFPQGIWCNKHEFLVLHAKLYADPMSVIFCPSHKSHVDYMIIHLLCIQFQLSLPAVIAGDNLNVAVFGKLLQNMGAIFIKRTFAGDFYTGENLHHFTEYLLRKKVNFEVFIEGTRSRNGKLLLPKFGIMKNIVSIVAQDRARGGALDVLMQPVAIQYEELYESDGYMNELMGNDKKSESFLRIINAGVSNILPSWSNEVAQGKGRIFVNLGKSFKLHDFLALPKQQALSASENIISLGFKTLHAVNRSAYIPDIALVTTALYVHYYNAYDKLDHTVDEARYKNTSGQVKYKNKITLVSTYDVVDEMKWLVEHLVSHDTLYKYLLDITRNHLRGELAKLIEVNVGKFLGKSIKVVKPSGGHLRVVEKHELRIESSIEMMYYKNLMLHLYIEESILALVILLLSRFSYNYNKILTKRKITRVYHFLRSTFRMEFLYVLKIDVFLDRFLKSGFIVKTDEDLAQNQAIYEVTNKPALMRLSLFVKPFLETLQLCLHNLHSILIRDQNEGISVKQLLKQIQLGKPHYDIKYHESINKMNLVNVIWLLNDTRTTEMYKKKEKKGTVEALRIIKEDYFMRFMNLIDFIYYYDGNYSMNQKLFFTYGDYEFKSEVISMVDFVQLRRVTKL